MKKLPILYSENARLPGVFMGIRNFLKLCWLTMNRNTGSRIRVAYGRAIIAEASLTQNAALANTLAVLRAALFCVFCVFCGF